MSAPRAEGGSTLPAIAVLMTPAWIILATVIRALIKGEISL